MIEALLRGRMNHVINNVVDDIFDSVQNTIVRNINSKRCILKVIKSRDIMLFRDINHFLINRFPDKFENKYYIETDSSRFIETYSDSSGVLKTIDNNTFVVIKINDKLYMTVKMIYVTNNLANVTEGPCNSALTAVKGYEVPIDKVLELEFFGKNRFRFRKKFMNFFTRNHNADTIKMYDIRTDKWISYYDKTSFDDLVIDHKTKDYIINSILNWKNNAKIYNERHIAHKLGILISGPAGSGKTSTLKAIATLLDAPIAIYSANAYTNDRLAQILTEFQGYFTEANFNKEKKIIILAIEDMDLAFGTDVIDGQSEVEFNSRFDYGNITETGTNKIRSKRSDAYQQILQILDGLSSVSNLVVIGTTTRLDLIDKDMIRYGRFDIHIEFTDFDRDRALEYVNKKGIKDIPSEEQLNEIETKNEYTYPVNPAMLRYHTIEYVISKTNQEKYDD